MNVRRPSRPSPAMIVAFLALLVALGGTSYAAIVLPASSVGTTQLKPKAVTGAKIAASAVTSSKIKDRSLRAKDFAAGQLPTGRQGQTGTQGPQGDTGTAGSAGRDGAAIAARVRSTAGVDTPADHSSVAVPLASNTWTQAAGEVDLGPYGRVTYTAPDASSCGATGLADLVIEIDVDGTAFSITNVATLRDGATRSATFDASRYLFESDSALARIATAKVSSTCESGSFAAPFTVSDLRFDLVRAT